MGRSVWGEAQERLRAARKHKSTRNNILAYFCMGSRFALESATSGARPGLIPLPEPPAHARASITAFLTSYLHPLYCFSCPIEQNAKQDNKSWKQTTRIFKKRRFSTKFAADFEPVAQYMYSV